jgi:hypothetical protein
MNCEIIYSEVDDEFMAVKAYLTLMKATVKYSHSARAKKVTMLFKGRSVQGFLNIVNVDETPPERNDKLFIDWSHKVLEELTSLNARYEVLSEKVETLSK